MEVGDDDIRPGYFDLRQRGLSMLGRVDLIAFLADNLPKELKCFGVVIYNKNTGIFNGYHSLILLLRGV
jgi:hypothetical protein